MELILKISVLGSGSWEPLAVSLIKNKHDVTLHSIHNKKSEVIKKLGENPNLPGIKLPDSLKLSDEFSELKSAEAVFFAQPSFATRSTAEAVKEAISPDAVLVSCSKGFESKTSLRLSQILEEELGGCERIAALSGPSHAEEVVRYPYGLCCRLRILQYRKACAGHCYES